MPPSLRLERHGAAIDVAGGQRAPTVVMPLPHSSARLPSLCSQRIPDQWLRRVAFRLVQSNAFEYFVMGVIALNVLAMAYDHHGIEDEPTYDSYVQLIKWFTYFYYCECLLKIFAMGSHYFQDGW